MVTTSDIEEKRAILRAKAPYSEGLKNLKRRQDLLDLAYANLKLAGSALTRGGVTNILSGNTIADIPLEEHRLIDAHRRLRNRFDDKLEMQMETDSIVLYDFCKILSGKEYPPYRTGSPILYHLDFVPGSDDSISGMLENSFRAIHRTDFGGDYCRRAAAVHLAVVQAYPFEEPFSEMSARSCMQYELFRVGLFPVDPGISEQEYNSVLSRSLKNGRPDEFADILRVAVFKKLHMLIDAAERGV